MFSPMKFIIQVKKHSKSQNSSSKLPVFENMGENTPENDKVFESIRLFLFLKDLF